jgi:hypothetical protein
LDEKASRPRRSETERRRTLARTFYDFEMECRDQGWGDPASLPSSRTLSARARRALGPGDMAKAGRLLGYVAARPVRRAGADSKGDMSPFPALRLMYVVKKVRCISQTAHLLRGARKRPRAYGTPARFVRRACYNAVTRNPRVGNKFMSLHRETRIGRCIPPIRFFVLAALAVFPGAALAVRSSRSPPHHAESPTPTHLSLSPASLASQLLYLSIHDVL